MKSPTYPVFAEVEVADNEGYIFRVHGSHGDIYMVGYDYDDGWYCPCPDYQFRKHECKHIRACKEVLKQVHVNVSDELFCEVKA